MLTGAADPEHMPEWQGQSLHPLDLNLRMDTKSFENNNDSSQFCSPPTDGATMLFY